MFRLKKGKIFSPSLVFQGRGWGLLRVGFSNIDRKKS